MSLYSSPDPSLLVPARKLRRIACLPSLVCGRSSGTTTISNPATQRLDSYGQVRIKTSTLVLVTDKSHAKDVWGDDESDDDSDSVEVVSPRDYRSAALECIVEEVGDTGSIRPPQRRSDPRRQSIGSLTITPVPSQQSLSLETMQRNMPYDWPVQECGYGPAAAAAGARSDASSSQAEVSDISTEILDAAAELDGDLTKVCRFLSSDRAQDED